MAIILTCAVLRGCTSEAGRYDTSADAPVSSQAGSTEIPTEPAAETTEAVRAGYFSTVQDVGLYEVEGQEQTYAFLYKDETFHAVYSPDNWKIIDSYKITNAGDIEMICQALAEEHPIHGKDMESYRTAEDMAHEWIQHNLAYKLLPADSPLKKSVKDVDIDPADQGKSYYDFYVEEVLNR